MQISYGMVSNAHVRQMTVSLYEFEKELCNVSRRSGGFLIYLSRIYSWFSMFTRLSLLSITLLKKFDRRMIKRPVHLTYSQHARRYQLRSKTTNRQVFHSKLTGTQLMKI